MSEAVEALAEALERDVLSIAFQRGRCVGSRGHERAAVVLEGRLGEAGCVPYKDDSFRLCYRRQVSFTNVVGVVPGRDRSKTPLLIGAHYDSEVPGPCADDNAAAVAIALAVAEAVSAGELLERDLIVAVFDAEEPPYFMTDSMGSVRFYKDQMKAEGVHAAFILDLVGHDVEVPMNSFGDIPFLSDPERPVPFLRNLLFITGAESHPGLRDLLGGLGNPKGLKVQPTLNEYVGDMSDHGIFRENGVPYLFLSCGRWEHYGRLSDTPERLNYTKMAHMVPYILDLLRGADSQNLPRTNKEQVCDTLALEIRHLKKVFGPLYRLVMGKLGICAIRTREDMNRFVEHLLEAGL